MIAMTVRAGREFLSIPGPTTVPDAVLQAMQRPAIDIYAGPMVELTHSLLADLALGPRESFEAWLGVLQDLTARGLNAPLLVIFDGAPGLRTAIRRVWPSAYRQRCQVHTMRTMLARLPRAAPAVRKRLIQQVFLAPSDEGALKRGRALIARVTDRAPAAMECLEQDLEECVTSRRFPTAYHRRIRPTNRLERLYGEGRRRTNVIPRFPTECSCLSLRYATLITASKRWRGVRMTPGILRTLEPLRREAMTQTIEAVA